MGLNKIIKAEDSQDNEIILTIACDGFAPKIEVKSYQNHGIYSFKDNKELHDFLDIALSMVSKELNK